MTPVDDVAEDGVETAFAMDGQEWRVAWYPPPDPPPGTPHGAAAICVTGDQVVLIGDDGKSWGLPGGRPEPGESMIDTMRREVAEEACAAEAFAHLDIPAGLRPLHRRAFAEAGLAAGSNNRT